ncbi:uncharacterized protein LOC128960083 [Oppia nitens]|uniref:uncharacterized protein LOC128960083 n=1 Tax=Oppia nitens TaxID=1686743 RepID=UPI0023DAE1B1|nr:uncharacterized protein LOC128960083 [Oppia nitens]
MIFVVFKHRDEQQIEIKHKIFLALKSTGFIVGTAVAVSYRYLSRQLVLAAAFATIAIFYTVIPLAGTPDALYFFGFTIGFGSSVLLSALYVWSVELWRGSRVPAVQIIQLVYNVGYIISSDPLYEFLLKQEISSEIRIDEDTDVRTRLMKPRWAIGMTMLIVPIILIVLYFVAPYKNNTGADDDDDNNDKRNGQGAINYDNNDDEKIFDDLDSTGIIVRALFALLLALFAICEVMLIARCTGFYGSYLRSLPLNLSLDVSLKMINTILYVMTAGSLINLLLPIIRVDMKYTVGAHLFLVTIGAILQFPGRTSLSSLWASNVFLGLGYSGMFANVITYAEQYMSITDTLFSLFLSMKGLVGLVLPFICFKVLADDQIVVYTVVQFLYVPLSLTAFVAIVLLVYRHSYHSSDE